MNEDIFTGPKTIILFGNIFQNSHKWKNLFKEKLSLKIQCFSNYFISENDCCC